MRVPFLTSAFFTFASAALACDSYDNAVSAVQAGDIDTATTLYEVLIDDNGCTDDFREWVGDFLAREYFALSLSTNTAAEKRGALEQALRYEQHWRSYAGLGQLDWVAERYADAALNYQLALNLLQDGDPSHHAEEDEIAELYRLATAALALSDEVVELPLTRSGGPNVILSGKVRGFEIEEVPLPITFEYNSTKFDAAGLDYANALVNHLLSTRPAVVDLGGHTDPVGGEAFNMELSAARADVLADYIRAAGFQGEILTTAYGESQLPTPPQGITPGSEEHHRIARRVSFAAR